MSAFKIYKFATYDHMQNHLNGAITGAANPVNGYSGIVGKTLVFTAPSSHTVTFTQGASQLDPTFLTFAEVAAQIKAVMTTLDVLALDGHLVLIETSPTSGVTVTSASTAVNVLGFNKSASTVGKVYKYPDGVTTASVPHWVQAYCSNGYHVLVVRE